ncbi:unnamed protein product [Sphacelaria rigidula]
MMLHALVMRRLTSHLHKAGTEHTGFSPARNQPPSAKRRDVFGESHEG